MSIKMSLEPLESSNQKAEYLVTALTRYGQGDYIGESISQLEHCLQAAHQAQKAGIVGNRHVLYCVIAKSNRRK